MSEASMEQGGNKVCREDKRPEALASRAVFFLVPSCFDASNGCGSKVFFLKSPGTRPLLYGIVMFRETMELATELGLGRS